MHARRWEPRFAWLLVCTTLACACDVSHQPHMSSIALDLRLSSPDKDHILGGLVNMFAQLCATSAPLCVLLCRDGRWMFVYLVSVSVCTALTSCVASAHAFVLCKTLVSLSVASLAPMAHAGTPSSAMRDEEAGTDLSARRSSRIHSLTTAAGLGQVLGHIASSYAKLWVPWRHVVRYMAAVTMLAACVAMYTARSGEAPAPPRDTASMRAQEVVHRQGARSAARFRTVVRDTVRRRTNVLLVLQSVCGCIPLGFISVFMYDHLITDQHMSVHEANLSTIAYGAGSGLGALFLGPAVFRRCGITHLPVALSVLTLSGAPMMMISLHPFRSLYLRLLLFFASGALTNANGANLRILLVHCNGHDAAPFVLSLFAAAGAAGRAVGPLLFAAICHQNVVAMPRDQCVRLIFCFWCVSGTLQLMSRSSVASDVALSKKKHTSQV